MSNEIDLREFREIFLDLGYFEESWVYTAGALETANKLISRGVEKNRAVKSALNSEGLYCPNDR